MASPPEWLESDAAGSDVRDVGWWVLVGTAAGSVAGLVVGGIGGRLAMLLLRVTSSGSVIGIETDDGFEIGVLSTKTIGLFATTAALGAVCGVLYAAIRETIPAALRLPLWTSAVGTAAAATIVHEDGVDFTLLEPHALSVLLFVALPVVGAAFVVVLVERWIEYEPWEDPAMTAALGLGAIAGTVAVVFSAIVAAGALAIRGAGFSEVAELIGRVLVPVGLAIVAVLSAWQLIDESARIIG